MKGKESKKEKKKEKIVDGKAKVLTDYQLEKGRRDSVSPIKSKP
jgi:hypothetical protein